MYLKLVFLACFLAEVDKKGLCPVFIEKTSCKFSLFNYYSRGFISYYLAAITGHCGYQSGGHSRPGQQAVMAECTASKIITKIPQFLLLK